MQWARKQTGFTIVELLIVVVVIAILAAITIISYNGIQNRAEASKTTSALNAYIKGLQMYKAEKGVYPTAGGMCLGDQYPPFPNQTIPSCRYSSSPIAVTTSAAARNDLKQYMGQNLPMPSVKHLSASAGLEYIGAHFYGSSYNYTLDGSPVVAIEYYIKGSTCPVGPVYAMDAPTFASPPVERSQAIGGDSRCMLLLPNS